MTNEKIIDAEFDKDDCSSFDSPISAYKAGFRAAERLAKIDVLEEIHKDIEGNMSYGIESRDYKRDILNIVYKKIQSLKAGN